MFDSKFETFLADTELARRLHYQVRYRVFCLDRGFEDPKKAIYDEERDHWDTQSRHFLVREKATGQWVATMRMILPEAKPFPIQTLCNISFNDDLSYRRDASCEISRLCMIKRYRGRQNISHSFTDESAGADAENLSEGVCRRAEPEIMLGLFRAGLAYSREKGLKQWYFLVTPALARMLARIGVCLKQLGPEIEHRGIRVPYVTDPERDSALAAARSPVVAKMLQGKEPYYRRFSELVPEHKVA